LSLIDADPLVEFVKGLLEQANILLVFFRLDQHLFNLALLLAQNLNCLRVATLFLIKFQFQVTYLYSHNRV
jgi:hypothetical protein